MIHLIRAWLAEQRDGEPASDTEVLRITTRVQHLQVANAFLRDENTRFLAENRALREALNNREADVSRLAGERNEALRLAKSRELRLQLNLTAWQAERERARQRSAASRKGRATLRREALAADPFAAQVLARLGR